MMEVKEADWIYQRSENAPREKISSNGTLTDDVYYDRYAIDGSSLIINEVKASDAGIYICGHGSQVYQKLQLNVSGM